MVWVVATVLGLFGIFSVHFVSKRLGVWKEKSKQAETVVRKKKRDEKISSKPFVSNPFGRMRDRRRK